MKNNENNGTLEERRELSFVEALKRGLADYDDINDYIARWHDGPYTCSVSEFLGMTRKQYLAWLAGQTPYLKRTFPKKTEVNHE